MNQSNKDRLNELVECFKNGNEEAFLEIYQITNDKAFYLAFSILKNRQDAEDVLQEAYVSMVRNIASLRDVNLFVSWFDSIVANKAKDLLRKKARDHATVNSALIENDTSDDLSTEEKIEYLIESMTISDLLNNLSKDKRQAIIYYYFCDYSIKEIAKSLDINEATVKSRIFQARKDLARLLCFENYN